LTKLKKVVLDNIGWGATFQEAIHWLEQPNRTNLPLRRLLGLSETNGRVLGPVATKNLTETYIFNIK
jgi:hypothetical protein